MVLLRQSQEAALVLLMEPERLQSSYTLPVLPWTKREICL
jgi:hypothetical protein